MRMCRCVLDEREARLAISLDLRADVWYSQLQYLILAVYWFLQVSISCWDLPPTRRRRPLVFSSREASFGLG